MGRPEECREMDALGEREALWFLRIHRAAEQMWHPVIASTLWTLPSFAETLQDPKGALEGGQIRRESRQDRQHRTWRITNPGPITSP